MYPEVLLDRELNSGGAIIRRIHHVSISILWENDTGTCIICLISLETVFVAENPFGEIDFVGKELETKITYPFQWKSCLDL